MLCEMCSSGNATVKVEVEGSKLNVCEKCSRFGKVLGRVTMPLSRAAKAKEAAAPPVKKLTESVQIIRSDYSKVIKQAREKLLLTQAEFAKKLMERESMLHNIESGHMKPDIALARKLEKVLKISLVEQLEVEVPSSQDSDKPKKGENLTIGDLIKVK